MYVITSWCGGVFDFYFTPELNKLAGYSEHASHNCLVVYMSVRGQEGQIK